MSWIVKIPYKVERNTHFTGKLNGKFIGYLDPALSDGKHENVFNIEILEASIKTSRKAILEYKQGDPVEFKHVEIATIKFAQPMTFHVESADNTNIRDFSVVVYDPKLADIKLSNQILEGRQMFGTINAEISGFFAHFETEYRKVEIGDFEDSEEGEEFSEIFNKENSRNNTEEQNLNITKASNKKETKSKTSDYSTWIQWFFAILGIILIGAVLLRVILSFAPFLLIIGAIALLIYTISQFGKIIGKLIDWISPFFGTAFLFWLVWTLFNGIGRLAVTDASPMPLPNPTPYPSPVPENTESYNIPDDIEQTTEFIFRELSWQNYSGQRFAGTLKIPVNTYSVAVKHKRFVARHSGRSTTYGYMLNDLYGYDQKHLGFLYSFIDSIQRVNQLSREGFAEMLVTCVQEQPYALVLDGACNANNYSDRFIHDFLVNNGECLGNEAFGILSPIEFITQLKGDCDTRALMLATLLKHYQIDAVVLSSELYGHAMLGVNLNYRGVSKRYRGNKYVVWETTSKDIRPGKISPEMRNMRAWDVNELID